jgi:hypothetical protein
VAFEDPTEDVDHQARMRARSLTVWKGARPLVVWRYRGWCAVCRVCATAVAVDCPDQPSALTCALNHYRMTHPAR